MKSKLLIVLGFVGAVVFFNSCSFYMNYTAYVDNLKMEYNSRERVYELEWTPLADADEYIVYAQYSRGDKTRLEALLNTEVPYCEIPKSEISYKYECLRVVAVKNGRQSYLSKKLEL